MPACGSGANWTISFISFSQFQPFLNRVLDVPSRSGPPPCVGYTHLSATFLVGWGGNGGNESHSLRVHAPIWLGQGKIVERPSPPIATNFSCADGVPVS